MKQEANRKPLNILQEKADEYAHAVYALARNLPDDERFGLTSQLRRASLSVPLNIIEGYARRSIKAEAQFLGIAYGSLKESQYLLEFAIAERYLTVKETRVVVSIGDEVACMLWTKLERYKNQS